MTIVKAVNGRLALCLMSGVLDRWDMLKYWGILLHQVHELLGAPWVKQRVLGILARHRHLSACPHTCQQTPKRALQTAALALIPMVRLVYLTAQTSV